ncbi:hypothetical protein K439DRAFT_1634819, partial [Ramaria rubella]
MHAAAARVEVFTASLQAVLNGVLEDSVSLEESSPPKTYSPNFLQLSNAYYLACTPAVCMYLAVCAARVQRSEVREHP